jgi:hypothetical protein
VRSSLRARFALLAGALVLAVATLVALGGYLTMRHALLVRAEHEANNLAGQLAAMVETSSSQGTSANANLVDIRDPALTQQLLAPGYTVEVSGPSGEPIQSSATRAGSSRPRLPAGFVAFPTLKRRTLSRPVTSMVPWVRIRSPVHRGSLARPCSQARRRPETRPEGRTDGRPEGREAHIAESGRRSDGEEADTGDRLPDKAAQIHSWGHL